MRQMGFEGVSKAGNGPERSGAWKICERIYRAAHRRVANYMEFIRSEIERVDDPGKPYVSEGADRIAELIDQINCEWTLERPDLKRFSRLVANWESLCVSELRAELDQARGG